MLGFGVAKAKYNIIPMNLFSIITSSIPYMEAMEQSRIVIHAGQTGHRAPDFWQWADGWHGHLEIEIPLVWKSRYTCSNSTIV